MNTEIATSVWVNRHATDLDRCFLQYLALEKDGIDASQCVWILPTHWKPETLGPQSATILALPVIWAEVTLPYLAVPA